MADVPYRKKLIEVAIPLAEINAASAKEKSIRHGHPSTLRSRSRPISRTGPQATSSARSARTGAC